MNVCRLPAIVLVCAAMTACATDSAPVPTATARTYQIPADLCQRLDLSPFTAVFGEPLPFGVDEMEPGACSLSYFGKVAADGQRAPGGAVVVWLKAFRDAAAAHAGFERTTSAASGGPYPEPIEQADAATYQWGAGVVRIELVEGNITMSLVASSFCEPCEPRDYQALPRLVHDMADQIYEILRA